MRRQGVEGFPYYLGVNTLSEVATRDDRVCVLNILGSESREVTPVSHAFSGGNVVFGTSPGRRGQVLATNAGDVPVYNNVREGLDDGLTFNTGVVYLPPSGIRDGVAELIRVNPDLRKIVLLTEKGSVHDAREIRALGQANGDRHLRRELPRGCRLVEPGPHRRRARGRPPRGSVDQGLDCDLLEFRRVHQHHRAVSLDGGLGYDDAHLVGEGRLHPLCRARLCARAQE